MTNQASRASLVDAVVDNILSEGLDDWIQASEVVSAIVGAGGPHLAKDVPSICRAVVGKVLALGLMQIGDVVEDGGFIPWELEQDAALAKFDDEWNRLKGLPDLGEVCWLSNTKAGDARANREGDT